MHKSDVICPKCNAGYRRIVLDSVKGPKGEFHCLLCNELLEVFDGSREIALRLTIQPERTFESRG
jgi:transposase-like protein